jgi:hypothetical protein
MVCRCSAKCCGSSAMSYRCSAKVCGTPAIG